MNSTYLRHAQARLNNRAVFVAFFGAQPESILPFAS